MEQAYEDRKVSYKEDTIWKILLGIAVFVIVITGYLAFKQLYYVSFGECAEVEYNNSNVKISDAEGKQYVVDISGQPVVVKDGKVRVYYFEGREYEAIGYMNPLFDYCIMAIFGALAGISGYKMYRLRHAKTYSEKHIHYDKREAGNEELAAAVAEARIRFRNELARRDDVRSAADYIALKKVKAEEKEFTDKVLSVQEKIYAVGELYIGVLVRLPGQGGYKAAACITNVQKYFKEPLKLKEDAFEVFRRAEETNKAGKLEEVVCLGEMYLAGVIYDTSLVPERVREDQLYYFVANPSMNDYVLMLPRRYYMQQDMEIL